MTFFSSSEFAYFSSNLWDSNKYFKEFVNEP